MKAISRNYTMILIAAGLAGMATGAWAQDTEKRDEVTLEEIIVTAQKMAQNMQEVPIAITAFTGEDLAKRQAVTLETLQGLVPNVQIGSFPNTPQ